MFDVSFGPGAKHSEHWRSKFEFRPVLITGSTYLLKEMQHNWINKSPSLASFDQARSANLTRGIVDIKISHTVSIHLSQSNVRMCLDQCWAETCYSVTHYWNMITLPSVTGVRDYIFLNSNYIYTVIPF